MKRLFTLTLPAAASAAAAARGDERGSDDPVRDVRRSDAPQWWPGTVVRWAFNNPHSWLYLNVKNPDGTDTLWSFEGSAPTRSDPARHHGRHVQARRSTFVTFMYCPLRKTAAPAARSVGRSSTTTNS